MNERMLEDYLHIFQNPPEVPLPDSFDFPHQYQPHPWAIAAALALQDSIDQHFQFDLTALGKMFGVLVVESSVGIRYLAGFSGKIHDATQITGFVPPIFDTLDPNGFFLSGEKELDALTLKIRDIEQGPQLKNLHQEKKQLHQEFESTMMELKSLIARNKSKRDALRSKDPKNETLLFQLNEESKTEQLQMKFLKRENKRKLSEIHQRLDSIYEEIEQLKTLRQDTSKALQIRLFEAYRLQNFASESSTIFDVFQEFSESIPPAGTGECVLPKLVHFAALHGLVPRCFAEFWWGAPPPGELRRHGGYYPACRAKCEPILKFQLKGLTVDKNPLLTLVQDTPLEILFEDESLIAVNKPYNMLSVPGRTGFDSVEDRLKIQFPKLAFIKAIHRLDMATSGILLLAKNPVTHAQIQQQFAKKKVKKCYEALLESPIEQLEGTISLPLRLNLDHRPHQMVCFEFGKVAVTLFNVLAVQNMRTRVAMYPETGRTHQLRVHAAHHQGLNTPIVGDELYGTPSDRLYLHAKQLTFFHPKNQQPITLFAEVPF